MANTLTNLIGTIYKGMDTVSNEQAGVINAVRKDTGISGAAKDQVIRFPIVPQGSLEAITPGAAPAASGSQTIGSDTLTLDQSYAYPLLWNGEEELSLDGTYDVILADQFAQAFRTFRNQIDTDLAALYVGASRAFGTAATTAFASAGNFADFAGIRRILGDNGAPDGALNLCLDGAAIANIRGVQNTLFKANEAGTSELLRQGVLGNVLGLNIHQSAHLKTHTAGTGAGYISDGATLPVGTTSLHVDTGTGTTVAGDIITFADDTNKYVVKTGFAGDGDMDVVIAEPGLMQALPDGKAMSITAASVMNLAFDKNAMVLATRPPAIPSKGDLASDQVLVTDPISGITYDISYYPQYKQNKIEVGLVWGVKLIKSEHVAILLG